MPTHDHRRKAFSSEVDERGHRVISLNTIRVVPVVIGAILSVSSLLGGVWAITTSTINRAIDGRVHQAIIQARPEMVSAAEVSHNAIRRDLNQRMDGVEKDLASATARQNERAQEIKDELLYIRTRVDYLVARGAR